MNAHRDPSEKYPFPVLLNPWKHHLDFLRLELRSWTEASDGIKAARPAILKLGQGVMDFYTGERSPEQVVEEVIEKLGANAQTAENLTNWIGPEAYRNLTLDDGSLWVCRLSDQERFLHIHPARFGPLRLRIKALSLKTALLTVLVMRKSGRREADLELVNQVRQDYLNESPMPTLRKDQGLGPVLDLFLQP